MMMRPCSRLASLPMYVLDESLLLPEAAAARWLALALSLDAHRPPGPSGFREALPELAGDPDFAAAFPDARRAAFVCLLPSQQIVAHRDPPLAEGIARWHVALQSCPACWCLHGDRWQRLLPRRRYSMRPEEEHGAVNWGHEPRIHLLVDG